MADQNRNQSRQERQQSQRDELTPDTQTSRSDQPGMGSESRGRSNPEPPSRADDRGLDDPRRDRDHDEVDSLDRDSGIESDIDDVRDTDEVDEGGRSSR